MPIQNIDLDTIQPNGKPGDPARTAFTKVNGNFDYLEDRVDAVSGVASGAATQQQLAQEVAARQDLATVVSNKANSSDVSSLSDTVTFLAGTVNSQGTTISSQGVAIAARATQVALQAEIDARIATDNNLAALPGRNVLLNANFSRCIRASSQSLSNFSGEIYGPDRWIYAGNNVTGNWAVASIPLGQVGNARNCMRYNFTAAQNAWVGQKIVDATTLANGKATFSFYMRSSAAGKKVGVRLVQSFGTGGSPSASVNIEHPTVITLTTAFQKYTLTFDVPSVAGKSVGSNNNDYLYLVIDFAGTGYGGALSGQTGLFEIAQCQLEAGSKATSFEVVPPSVEQARCNWYARSGTLFLRGNGTASAGAGTFLMGDMRVPPVVTFQNASYAYGSSGVNSQSYQNGVEVFVSATGAFAFTTGYFFDSEI